MAKRVSANNQRTISRMIKRLERKQRRLTRFKEDAADWLFKNRSLDCYSDQINLRAGYVVVGVGPEARKIRLPERIRERGRAMLDDMQTLADSLDEFVARMAEKNKASVADIDLKTGEIKPVETGDVAEEIDDKEFLRKLEREDGPDKWDFDKLMADAGPSKPPPVGEK